ncbi:hypothetical protein HKX48_001253 [Thoreauomyces humboldtii]|nr:hypothetical protein HKX48_001253 [Thoreauomyces humboldtii]
MADSDAPDTIPVATEVAATVPNEDDASKDVQAGDGASADGVMTEGIDVEAEQPSAADEATPAEPPGPPANVDLAVTVTPAQAIELHQKAEELKAGFALLAMKRIENAFAGMDDPDADGDGGGEGDIDLQAEEDKLNAAMASYTTQMEEYGIPNGSPEYLAMLADIANAEAAAAAKQEIQDTPAVEEAKVERPDIPLPYHDVWNHNGAADGSGGVAPEPSDPPPAPDVVDVVETVAAPPIPEPEPVVESAPAPEEAPAEKVPAPAPTVAAVPKRLPPVVLRPPRGRVATRIPLAKQSIAPRTLALAFTSFPTAFPGESPLSGPQFQPQQQQPSHQPQQQQQQQQSQPHSAATAATATSIAQLPLDASGLRMVHSVASSSSPSGAMRGVVMNALGSGGPGSFGATFGNQRGGGGVAGGGVGGNGPGGLGGGGMMVMNTATPRSAYPPPQQQQAALLQSSKRPSAQVIGGISHAIVGGTGRPSTQQQQATRAKSSAGGGSLAPRSFASGHGGIPGVIPGPPSMLNTGDHLPPIKNSAGQKMLHAGGNARHGAGH